MSTEEFYTNLEKHLKANSEWPSVYMFKFILPNDNRKMALLRQVFEEDSRFFEKNSRKGNYVSVTVKIVMMNPEEVISRYKQVAGIEGIIML